jgi:hypothetical protein
VIEHEQSGDLSPDDKRLLDALVEAGFDPASVPVDSPADRGRLEALLGLFELLEDYPVEDPDEALVPATLARVERVERDAASRLLLDAVGSGGARSARRFRVPDFISIAAVILIVASIAVPLTSQVRHRSIQGLCSENLRVVGGAFAQYAQDYEGALPRLMAGFGAEMSWDRFRNSVNLRPMIERGYCDQGHLVCPGNHAHDTSYSYQWQGNGGRRPWHGGVVLGDRNPVMDAALAGIAVPALTVSLNHGGRGQNVLAGDLSQHWLEEPLYGGRDNIWLPFGVHSLRPGDAPASPEDIFLAH